MEAATQPREKTMQVKIKIWRYDSQTGERALKEYELEAPEWVTLLDVPSIEVAAELGFELRDAATGGASDANTTSAAGTPTIDGLGPIGGDDHAPAEWLDLSSVVPRISLLAGIVARL